jgi:thioredoxin-related protein
MSAAGPHPHFISPHSWHTTLSEGLVAAHDSGRAVLLIVGRQSCGGCRALVEKTIAKEEIHEYLDAHYVCVAGDADTPEPAVAALVKQMVQHDRTPLCLYLSAEGKLLHSTSGGRPPAVFLSDMLEAPHRRA